MGQQISELGQSLEGAGPYGMVAGDIVMGIGFLVTLYEGWRALKANTDDNDKANDDAWDKTEDGDTIVVDKSGNAIRVKKGQKVEGNPDGDSWQVKDKDGKPTGDRRDGKGHPKQKDPKAKQPHGHRVGPDGKPITDEDGNPHLPTKSGSTQPSPQSNSTDEDDSNL